MVLGYDLKRPRNFLDTAALCGYVARDPSAAHNFKAGENERVVMKEKILTSIMWLVTIFGVTSIILLARVAGPSDYEKSVLEVGWFNQEVVKAASSVYEEDFVDYLDAGLFVSLQSIKLPTERLTDYALEGDNVAVAMVTARTIRHELIRETGIKIPEIPTLISKSYTEYQTMNTIIALEATTEVYRFTEDEDAIDGRRVATLRMAYVFVQTHLLENGLMCLESSPTQIGLLDLQARFQNELEAIRATYYN